MPKDNEQATTQNPTSANWSTGGWSASAAGAARAAQRGTTLPGKVIDSSHGRYVIAPRRIHGMMYPVGLQPTALDYIEQALRSSPDVEVIDRIGSRDLVTTLADGMSGVPQVLIADMAADKADMLRQQTAGQLIVERDQPLRLDLSETREPGMVVAAVPAGGPVQTVAVMVLGGDDAPVKDAEVHLFGTLLPVSTVTDDRGIATLSIAGDEAHAVTGLYIKPRSDHWTFYQSQPALDVHQTNLVFVRPLSESFQNFPRQQVMGWGQKAMRLDQLPATYRGQGIRVAIVDSGASTSHPDLRGIKFGFDVLNKQSNSGGWNQDTIAHGSHCAGIIAGADTGTGIRGFAPDSEVHIWKQFPGGRISQLVEALEYCIEKQIDVVNLSLSGTEPSEVLEQQILRAKRLGVACIVAAGNTGGPVQYPASSPNVLAVAAIGKLGEFPADSYHAHTIGLLDGNGFFSPKFTSYGPEIGLCAPGVAILSSVPPDKYAVWDGTSMAASHVTGLAALVLAHHPDFQGPFRVRSAERVERLFEILKLSAQMVNVGDPRRTGFGIPDVLVALGLAPRHLGVMQAGVMQAGVMQGVMPLIYGHFPQFAPMMAGFGFGTMGVR